MVSVECWRCLFLQALSYGPRVEIFEWREQQRKLKLPFQSWAFLYGFDILTGITVFDDGVNEYACVCVCVLASTWDGANIYFIYIFMPRIKKIYADFVTFFLAILQTFFSHYCLLNIHDFVFYSSLPPPRL